MLPDELWLCRLRRFRMADDGAVTVDWTVLAAAVVGLGIASVGAVRTGVVSLSGDVSGALSSASIAVLGTLGDGVASVAQGYTLLVASAETYAGWIEELTNLDEADVNQVAANYLESANAAIDRGDYATAGQYLDVVAAANEAMQANNYVPTADPSAFADALDAYHRSVA